MPVLFVGHGSPMNAVEDNEFSRGFAALAAILPRPRAILAVSAHWYVEGTFLTGDEHPPTIHDFSGFPETLFEIRYPAPGSVPLAERVRGLLGLGRAALRTDWGLDHGTWSVLKWIYPAADVPVVQLSLDAALTPRQHFDLARPLGELRREGVLVMGSGNVTHDLREAFRRMRDGDSLAPESSRRFDEAVKRSLLDRDMERLVGLWPGTDDGRRNHPTPDHWLPLLYACAAADPEDLVEFPIEGFDLGLSMRSVIFGRTRAAA
jgi:4,5-DOPA dioxygenase extradiol